MDAFRGYYQIFIPDGVLCYLVMAFRLKNLGAKYTRMVAKQFRELLGKSMEAYVDDMLVKSREEATHASNLVAYILDNDKVKY